MAISSVEQHGLEAPGRAPEPGWIGPDLGASDERRFMEPTFKIQGFILTDSCRYLFGISR